jgi:hypothetical protein
VQSCAEIEEVVRGVEGVAWGEELLLSPDDNELDVIVVDTDLAHRNSREDEEGGEEGQGKGEEEERWIDAVVISHKFTDHMHKPTLLKLSPRTPVLATLKAYAAIKSWGHFDTVREIGRFGGDWRDDTGGVLPGWIGVSRVAYQGNDLKFALLSFCHHDRFLLHFSLPNHFLQLRSRSNHLHPPRNFPLRYRDRWYRRTEDKDIGVVAWAARYFARGAAEYGCA